MKKFLLTAALVLALVVSLTAGTMAYYSTTVGTISSTVTMKKFSITADKSTDSFKTNLKLAPGDKVVYTINVTNGSEVNANTAFVAKLVNLQEAFPNLSVKVERTIGTTGSDASATLNALSTTGALGTGVTNSTVNGYMTIGSVDKYVVTVEWDRGSKWDKDTTATYINKTFALQIDISGEQADEQVTYAAEK